MSTLGSSSSSYWCYRCNRFIRIRTHIQDSPVSCPDCNGGFIEQINSPTGFTGPEFHRSRPSPPSLRRGRRTGNGGERSPFNPVIVLRVPSTPEYSPAGEEYSGTGNNNGNGNAFELFYDDGAGSGLRPLPPSMSEFLLGSGFDRLLDQLAQIEGNGLGRIDNNNNPPASKAVVDSMPVIEIQEDHILIESYCAVCKEPFELGCEAKEMPCLHLYHPDCIHPWLALRNSCPVCRHELPVDPTDGSNPNRAHSDTNSESGHEEAAGLTIWRLPGGGFAVGRFTGGRRGGERELPVVFTEMDGGFNHNGVLRRIQWATSGHVSRERSGLGRVIRNLFSCFGGGFSRSRRRALASSSSSSSDDRGSQRSRSVSSRRLAVAFDAPNEPRRW